MRPVERSAGQHNEAKVLLRRAQEQAERGEYAAALATIQRAMKSGADQYICYLQIAALEQRRHRHDAAKLALQHAIELQPHRTDAHERMVELYLESGEVDAAIEQASQVLQRDPESVTVRLLLVVAHLEKGDWEAALRVLDDLIALAPNEPLYHFHQAQVFQEMGQWGLAVMAYERVVELGMDPTLSPRAEEAVQMLDRIQIERILTLVREDPQFRVALQQNPLNALLDRHFLLSDAGMKALHFILRQLDENDFSWKPVLYH